MSLGLIMWTVAWLSQSSLGMKSVVRTRSRNAMDSEPKNKQPVVRKVSIAPNGGMLEVNNSADFDTYSVNGLAVEVQSLEKRVDAIENAVHAGNHSLQQATPATTITVMSIDHAFGTAGTYFNFDAPSGWTSHQAVDVKQCRNGQTIWSGRIMWWNNQNGGMSGNSHGRRDSGSSSGQWQVGDIVTEGICQATSTTTTTTVQATVYSGSFSLLPSYNDGSTYATMLSGTAELRVTSTGISTTVRVSGTDSKFFKAHLHAAPCSSGGGAHYQDPNDMSSVANAVRENWPDVTCDATGTCGGAATNQWMPTDSARASGLSIVIHDTPHIGARNNKMLCADLNLPKAWSGSFAKLASYSMASPYADTISGTAELFVGATGISTRVHVSGGSINVSLNAHLHAAPCSADGGGHYQNPGNTGVVNDIEENWPKLVCNSRGNCDGNANNMWIPTGSALASGLSIVIHDTPTGNSKMLCADLIAPQVYSGHFSTLPSYDGRSPYATMLSGTAELRITTTGISTRVRITGTSSKFFKAHLHGAPCSAGGGRHYQDPHDLSSVANAVRENWPGVTCDATGMCGGAAANHWIPMESELVSGLSIVIHDTPRSGATNNKMLCADLRLPLSQAACQVTVYEHWPEDISAGIAGLEAAVQAWGGKFPTGASKILHGAGNHPLAALNNLTSSVKVEGVCCKAYGYTAADCSGPQGTPIEATTKLLQGLPNGVVTPATGLASVWGCNDCAQCVKVVQQCSP